VARALAIGVVVAAGCGPSAPAPSAAPPGTATVASAAATARPAAPSPSPTAAPSPPPAAAAGAVASPASAGASPSPLPTSARVPRPVAGGIPGLGAAAADPRDALDAIPPDGRGLPPGGGTAAEGRFIYAAKCASCHGVRGQGSPRGGPLVGPVPWQAGQPITVGNAAPYAPPIFGYIWTSQPYDRPRSLTADEAYALTAFLLQQHGIIGEDERMDAQTLPQVRMPNRDAYERGEPRPDAPPAR
jgi:S-disulfanyl-L-cysteine oxidoreductase SoxD